MTSKSHLWANDLCTLIHAYAPRPPIQYVVRGLFALPSLNIVYGSPGCMKSLLLADLACCVAGGLPWLEKWQHETAPIQPRPVIQAPVFWVDFDNGLNRTHNRFEAIGHTYNLSDTSPLYYTSMPAPDLDASKATQVADFTDLINYLGAKLVILDNLAAISGGRDENSSEMVKVVYNLRRVAEKSGAALVVIHHSRKENGFKGKAGDNLRGFSGIRGAIDTGLYIDREAHTDQIQITAEKVRDVDIEPFAALWTYTHKPGYTDLETGRFFGIASQLTSSQMQKTAIEEAVLDALNSVRPNGALTQNQLKQKVKAALTADGITAGLNGIEYVIKSLAGAGKIRATNQGNTKGILYSL